MKNKLFPFFPNFIAGRINSHQGTAFAQLIARIAIGSIGIGMTTVILSSVIFNGFRDTIQEKIFSFSGHIQLSKYNRDNTYEAMPVSLEAEIYQSADSLPEIAHIQHYTHKAGLLKTDDEVMGVVFKGVGEDFDTTRFYKNLAQGQGLLIDTAKRYSTEVLISQKKADRMELEVGDDVVMYFVQDPPKYRKIQVRGIYNTGIEDFDELFILGDYRLTQRINNWSDSLVGGFELFATDFDRLLEAYQEVVVHKDYFLDVSLVTRKYGHLFDWFFMVSQHVQAILAIILSVASFNIISVMLIMIIERTEMIGTLKALGATNGQLQRVFLLRGLKIGLRGILWGNGLGIGLALLQQQFQLIPLDPENYYMDAVPILFDWGTILAFNVAALLLVLVILLLPTFIVANISPIKAIKFD